LENVGGLLSRKHRYFETILKDLAESGYDARWKVISASEVGAPHKRDRLWVVAHTNGSRELQSEGSEQDEWRRTGYDGEEVSNTSGERLEGWELPIGESEEYATIGGTCWWHFEPRVGRVAHGMAHRVDRLKALGNGQVPAVAETAFRVLTR
jgi:DNA (cytosine-5)-methyltransferase 1